MKRLIFPLILLAAAGALQFVPVREVLGISGSGGPFLAAALCFLAAVIVFQLLERLWRGWYARRGAAFPLPDVLRAIIMAVLYIGVFLIVLRGFLHVDITPFLAGSALLTAILGLAFQGVLSNLLSGMSLHFTRAFHKGDWVEVGEEEGVVIDTNWRETRIFNRESNVVVLPNNLMASEKITNFSRPQKRSALILPVMAGFSASPVAVFEALRKAAEDSPAVLEHPAPEAHLLAYEDLGIRYAVKFWIADFSRKYPILAEVGRNIWYRFHRSGIEIPAALNPRLREVAAAVTGGPSPGEEESGDRRARIQRGLLRSPLLRAPSPREDESGELLISEADAAALAESARLHHFAAGEVVFRQGERGESCFIVISGRLRGEIRYQENGEEHVSNFGVEPFGLFGEMSLLTGMPRTATGIVEEASALIEIRAEDFARLMERHPKVAERIAAMMSERNRENRAFLEKIRDVSPRDIEAGTSKRSILDRLKSLLLK